MSFPKVSSSPRSIILFLSILFISFFIFSTLHNNINSKRAVTGSASLSQCPHHQTHLWHKAGIQKYLLNKHLDRELIRYKHEKQVVRSWRIQPFLNSREKKMTSRNKIHIYFARQLLLVQIGFTCDLILQKDDLAKKKKS